MFLRPRRAGYTLLEVILAMTIGAVLMAALYTALDLTIRHAQAGREKVEQATLARSLFTRITADISPNLSAPVPAQSGSSSSGQGGGGGAGQGGASTGGAAPGSSSSQGGGGSSSASGTPVAGLNGSINFNLGVQGDSSTLALYTSRVPHEVDAALTGDAVPVVSDLRRIMYWVAANGGLARQEIKIATSDDAINSVQPDASDEANFIIADEVRSVTFQYFDGTNWQDTWDGTAVPDGGSKPKGPPVAIAVTIALVVPGSSNESGDPVTKTFRHVVVIPTANGTTTNSSTSTSQ